MNCSVNNGALFTAGSGNATFRFNGTKLHFFCFRENSSKLRGFRIIGFRIIGACLYIYLNYFLKDFTNISYLFDTGSNCSEVQYACPEHTVCDVSSGQCVSSKIYLLVQPKSLNFKYSDPYVFLKTVPYYIAY